MMRIAVLIGNKGTGSNLEAILKAIETKKIRNGKVTIVVSDKADAKGFIHAKQRNIETKVYPVNGKAREQYDNELGRVLKNKYNVDLVVLAGWMRILTNEFIKYFPNKTINLHPGLLPDKGDYVVLKNGKKVKAIRGLHTNAAVQFAIDNDYPATGSTVHIITEKVDDGPVLARSEVAIKKTDTIESLYGRIKNEEHKILPLAIAKICNGLTILVIGSGGREHAIIWKLDKSPKVAKLYCAPGNPGIGRIAENVPIEVTQITKLVSFVKSEKIDITFVGPEIPLIDGIVDTFKKNKLTIVGPSKKASQLEGSKSFAKKIMEKYKIPTAAYKTFKDYVKAKKYLENSHYPLVIKASGQAAGKGVLVTEKKSEALSFLSDVMVKKIFGNSGNEVVIEEFLEGPEVSFMVATDGVNFVSFLPSQDHKRIYDQDRGPNTGGMGSYAPVPFVTKKLIKTIEKQIVKPTINGMRKEGIPYEGILYPGIILTKKGPKVLEFNCRFGDPETQSLIALLKTDLVDILEAISKKRVRKLKLEWHKGSAVCVVIASKGYPGNHEKGKEIKGLENLYKEINIFHAGTSEDKGTVISSGGRVLGLTTVEKNLQTAIKKVYMGIGPKGINFSGMQYRKDIASKAL